MVCLVKAMVFPVVMYGCESWTVKKAEHWRIDAFELWCWRRLLRVSWTARRSNQFILKEICPEYSLKGLMSKLKLQYFGHLMWTADSFEKTLDAGKDWGQAMTEDEMVWMASLTQWIWIWVDSGTWWWTGRPGALQSMVSQRVKHDWATKPNWNVKSSFYWLLFMYKAHFRAPRKKVEQDTHLFISLQTYSQAEETYLITWKQTGTFHVVINYDKTKNMGYGNYKVKEDSSWAVIFIRDEYNKKKLPTKTCGWGKFPDEVMVVVKTLQ